MRALLLGITLALHGVVHPFLWSLPAGGASADASTSVVLTGTLGLGVVAAETTTALVGFVAAAVFSLAGLALVLRRGAWRALAVAGAFVSLALMAIDFDPGLWIGVLINVVVIGALLLRPRPVRAPAGA